MPDGRTTQSTKMEVHTFRGHSGGARASCTTLPARGRSRSCSFLARLPPLRRTPSHLAVQLLGCRAERSAPPRSLDSLATAVRRAMRQDAPKTMLTCMHVHPVDSPYTPDDIKKSKAIRLVSTAFAFLCLLMACVAASCERTAAFVPQPTGPYVQRGNLRVAPRCRRQPVRCSPYPARPTPVTQTTACPPPSHFRSWRPRLQHH